MNDLRLRVARFVLIKLGVTGLDLISRRRNAGLVRARMLFVWCVRWSSPTTSYPTIAAWMERDHSSILHLSRRAQETISRDAEFARLTEEWRAAERATMTVPHACA